MDDDSRIKNIIYKRKNGEDIINDIEAIESCKKEQSRDVIDNARLGSIDKYGNYVIIPDIKRELISLPKLVYNTTVNLGTTVYELKSNIPIFGDVFFKLVITKDQASLALIETVNREAGGYREMYEEVFDSYAMGEERLPTSYLFRIYNISEKPIDSGKDDYINCENILMRKVYLNLLSKELSKISKVDEKRAFDQMVATLKSGGEYGKRVLGKFVERLKDRPAVFEIVNTDNYQKAVNEVLLSSLDIATTEEDKQNSQTRRTYLDVINARNANIEEEIKKANERVDEKYVKAVVKKATDKYTSEQENQKASISEYFEKLEKDKKASQIKKHTLEKPVLKQGKKSSKVKGATKEEKIKALLDKKKKKTPANKKLKAAKGKTATKKLKAKTKSKSKSKAKSSSAKKKKRVVKKPSLKNKKKKVQKTKKPLAKKKKVKKLAKSKKSAKKLRKPKKASLKNKKKKVKKPKKALKKKKKFAKSKKGAKKLRKPKKGKLKKKNKKFKKAKAPNKAKAKGSSFKPKAQGKGEKKKKAESKNITIRMALSAAFAKKDDKFVPTNIKDVTKQTVQVRNLIKEEQKDYIKSSVQAIKSVSRVEVSGQNINKDAADAIKEAIKTEKMSVYDRTNGFATKIEPIKIENENINNTSDFNSSAQRMHGNDGVSQPIIQNPHIQSSHSQGGNTPMQNTTGENFNVQNVPPPPPPPPPPPQMTSFH